MELRNASSCGCSRTSAPSWSCFANGSRRWSLPIDLAPSGLVTSPITEIETILRTIGAIAVIAGTILVVLQLRVNARNVRSRNAFDLIAKVIDPTFPHRRHLLYEVAEKHAGGDWTGFDRTLQDFEVRNFANVYEQLGLLARKGVVDLEDVLDALSAQPMADWDTFQPIRTHIIDEAGKAFPALKDNQPGLDAIYWPNFGWLAEESRKWTLQRASDGTGWKPPDPDRDRTWATTL